MRLRNLSTIAPVVTCILLYDVSILSPADYQSIDRFGCDLPSVTPCFGVVWWVVDAIQRGNHAIDSLLSRTMDDDTTAARRHSLSTQSTKDDKTGACTSHVIYNDTRVVGCLNETKFRLVRVAAILGPRKLAGESRERKYLLSWI